MQNFPKHVIFKSSTREQQSSTPQHLERKIKMIDINTLAFEEVTTSPESYWAANIEEVDGIVELQAIYSVDFNTDALKVSLAVGNPQVGDWADSSNTNDWPQLDAMFGRSAWQAWLADKQEEVLAEYSVED